MSMLVPYVYKYTWNLLYTTLVSFYSHETECVKTLRTFTITPASWRLGQFYIC